MAVVGYIDGYVDENNREYGLTDTVAQGSINAIKDGSSIDSFGDVETALATKVDKVAGKGLSTNDYDNTAKGIVDNIQSNVIANTQLIKDTVGWSGKNLLGYEVGKAYNASGEKINSTHGVISAIIPVSVGDKFIASKKTALISTDSNLMVRQYNSNGAFVSSVNALPKANLSGVYTVPSGIAYVGFVQFYNDGTITEDIVNTYEMMVRKADILDATYEPYRGTTAFPRDEQAVLGAKNLYDCIANTTTDEYDLTWTVDATDKNIITVSGTPSGFKAFPTYSNNVLPAGSYILSGILENTTNILLNFLGLRNGTTIVQELPSTLVGTEFYFDIPENVSYDNIYITLKRNDNNVACSGTIKLMIRLATDTDPTYAPFAMTNRELTEKVQGIINAATNAADFAAFKTAIGNL